MTTYVIGQNLRLRATITDTDSGDEVDPDTVACTIEAPDGTQSTPSVTNTATGVYVAAFVIAMKGRHAYRFAATGSYIGAVEGSFDVAESNFV